MSVNPGATTAATSAAASAAAYQQVLNASRAAGAIVTIDPREFQRLLDRCEETPLIVHATGGWLTTNYQYLTCYKGIYFFSKSSTKLYFNRPIEFVEVEKIWIPG